MGSNNFLYFPVDSCVVHSTIGSTFHTWPEKKSNKGICLHGRGGSGKHCHLKQKVEFGWSDWFSLAFAVDGLCNAFILENSLPQFYLSFSLFFRSLIFVKAWICSMRVCVEFFSMVITPFIRFHFEVYHLIIRRRMLQETGYENTSGKLRWNQTSKNV